MNKIILVVLFVFIFYVKSIGQYITLPDTVFANFIATTYPSVVNSSKQLDTTTAKTITGTFTCKWQNIADVTGLQYFQSISNIDLTGNRLTTIPSLTNTTGLTRLIVDTNNITSLPALNQLSNLQFFSCRANQLNSVPSLAGLTNLAEVMIDRNKLTQMPDLTGCTALWHLIISDNSIDTLPDMSTLSSLKRFLLTNNPLKKADLTSIPNLQQVKLIYTQLSEFPKLKGTQFTQIDISKNYIDSLPDLSAFTSLTIFNIQENNLTFEDILPLTSNPNFSSFTISPQALIGEAQTLQLITGDSLIWNLGIDSTITSNTYYWYKDTIPVSTTTTNTFKIDSVTFLNAGVYTVQVKNSTPSLSSLILSSYPVTLSLISCFNANNISLQVPENNCIFPLQVSVNESSISGGYPPYSYTIVNSVNGEQATFNSYLLSIPQEGSFDLQIKDSKGCFADLKKEILITRGTQCDPVIYPDSRGPESSYYIENKGSGIIYNVAGAVVRHFNAPNYWDGTSDSGAIVDSGLYMIVINDQVKIQISVIRRD